MKRSHAVWLGLLFALAVGRLWLMALTSSLWVDEMGTAFVVERPHDPSLAVAPQVPASLYYWLPRASVRVWGTTEIVWRIPSVLVMLAAVWMIARLAARLIHPQAAWFAAFACLALRGIDYFAVDARPYALGILAAAAAIWFEVRWLDTARWRDAAAFAVCAALIWRIHLVYWPFYLVLALYALVRLARGQTSVGWKRTAAVFALIGLALVPVAVQALAIERNAQAHVIVAPPSWRDFLHLLRYNLILIAGAGAWIVRRSSRIGLFERASGEYVSATLIFAWWLVLPIVLYGLSVTTGQSVYLTRYLSLALPGAALAATWVASRFLPVRWWRAAAALMGLGALAMLGQWTALWPAHERSDWRSAAAEVNRMAPAQDVPVICPSPFIEARWPVWRPDYQLPGFLYATLAYYPLRGKIVLFPFADSPQADAYATQLLAAELTERGSFVLYGGAGNTRFWQKWFAARPELRQWTNRRDEFGDVFVVHFWDGR